MAIPLAGIGAVLGGAGTALGGIGSVVGAFRGGGAPAADYSALYASELAPGQTRISIAGQELAQMMAPYIRALNFQTNVLGQQAYDQFSQAISKEQMQSGLQAGIASQYASSVIGNQDLAAKARTSTELLGPETAANLTKLYAQGVSDLQKTGLVGETTLLNPTAQAQATAGLQANLARNQLASDISKTNLDISKMQEDTRNKLALQRGQVEGQLALKRFGAGLALAGQRSFA
jgi:hypothetical protein